MSEIAGHILIVDDQEPNRDLLLRRLTKYGCTCEVAAGGEEARALLQSSQFHLVLLDIQMPGISGLEILAEIRAKHSLAELPVILVTARSESRDVVEGLNAGANDYVTKPIDFPVALARVRTQLALKHAETARRESEERYALAAAGARDGIWDWNLKTGVIHFSSRWAGMLGYTQAEVGSGLNFWLGKVHPEDRAAVQADLQEHIDGVHDHFENEHRMLHKDGTYRWVLSRGLAVRDASNTACRMAGSQSDITSGKIIDSLTGLPTRLLFMERLRRRVERARKHPGSDFAVLFVAMDRPNLISDSLGHDALDELVTAFARRLQTTVRRDGPSDRNTVARHHGGEFTILLDAVNDRDQALTIATCIAQMVNVPYFVGVEEIFMSAHVGIAIGSGDVRPEELLRNADTAMYHARALGKDRFTIFDKGMGETAATRLRTETELRHAVRRGEFENWYQPIIDLRSGSIHGLECLVRWRHPRHGIVGPNEFIGIAEDNGFISAIGRSVLKDACKHLALWRNHDVGGQLPISVNLSIHQLESGRLLAEIQEILLQAAIDPTGLKFEITETLVTRNLDHTKRVLQELRAFGAKVALDDFGTGYSSLSSLKDFPLDELKIDRAFIAPLGKTDEATEIVRTILGLARTLDLKVTAEGVETENQLNLLRQLGCDYAQGYFFSKPIAHRQTTDLLRADPQWTPSAEVFSL